MSSRAENKYLQDLADKLGLDEDTTLKAKEYLRVYQIKSTATLLNISHITKCILCLDLASKSSGIPFDQETALKLSAVKPRIYNSHLNNLEKILGLDRPLTMTEACVVLGCTELKEMAENLLEKYQNAFPLADFSHPQYIAVALWTISKLKSHKLIKQKVISMSRLKPGQWKELENTFKKFADGVKIDTGKNQGKKCNNLAQIIETHAMSKENENVNSTSKTNDKEVEDYDVWKQRILKAAFEALKLQEA